MTLLCKGSCQPQRLTEGLTTTYSKPEGALSYALRSTDNPAVPLHRGGCEALLSGIHLLNLSRRQPWDLRPVVPVGHLIHPVQLR